MSQTMRFEIFKRDGFECQYCGAHPPGVLLNVDHILAVANGGSDDFDNLITACQSCNAGKGVRDLSVAPASLAQRAADIREREQQIAGYQAILVARAERISAEIETVVRVFEQFTPGFTLSGRIRVSIKQFIARLGVGEVVDAMEIACARNVMDVPKYFCGICWKKIRGE